MLNQAKLTSATKAAVSFLLVRLSNCCGKMKKIRVMVKGISCLTLNLLPALIKIDHFLAQALHTHTHCHALKLLYPHYIFIICLFSLLIRILMYIVRDISDMTYHAESLQVLVRAELPPSPPPSLTRLFLVTCFERLSWLLSDHCYFKHLTRNRHI